MAHDAGQVFTVTACFGLMAKSSKLHDKIYLSIKKKPLMADASGAFSGCYGFVYFRLSSARLHRQRLTPLLPRRQ